MSDPVKVMSPDDAAQLHEKVTEAAREMLGLPSSLPDTEGVTRLEPDMTYEQNGNDLSLVLSMVEDPEGRYVAFADWQNLEAKRARLAKELTESEAARVTLNAQLQSALDRSLDCGNTMLELQARIMELDATLRRMTDELHVAISGDEHCSMDHETAVSLAKYYQTAVGLSRAHRVRQRVRIERLEAELARVSREPKRFDQIENGCWTACIAGLTGIDKAELDALVPPPFVPGESDVWTHRADAKRYNELVVPQFLSERGWLILSVKGAPKGFAIGTGQSGRGMLHAVIVKDGVLWHDPHPSRDGVPEFESFEVLIPFVHQET